MSKTENNHVVTTTQSGHNIEQFALHRVKDPTHGLVVGLDILEYLSKYRQPTALTELAAGLNTSLTTLYRSIRLLEERGYVVKGNDRGTYGPTSKLYDLCLATPANRRLFVQAQPIMQALSEDISQSCNLSVPNSTHMAVIASMPSPGPFGINIPLGYKYDVATSAPGLTFFAFGRKSGQVRPRKARISNGGVHTEEDIDAVRRDAIERGYVERENPCLPEVRDLCCAILENDQFVAALSIPFIKTTKSPTRAWCLAALQQAAEQLSRALSASAMVA